MRLIRTAFWVLIMVSLLAAALPESRSDVLYTVTAVILIVWIGLAFFLYRLDRKITRLEKNQQKMKQ
ncbi:MAG: hypothetical protein A2W19_06945 [Spirochaetes bacterium RBG_16_49_21]|nr:MAG: hypothetical protein A2W19_06945 [Spirochaetes bacterium RBG_16_49_21]